MGGEISLVPYALFYALLFGYILAKLPQLSTKLITLSIRIFQEHKDARHEGMLYGNTI